MPSDYKNVSLKMVYPWQGSNQQQLVQSPVMINQTSSTPVINPPVNSDDLGDSQFNNHHHLNQGQNSNNCVYNHLSSSSQQQQQQQQQHQYQLSQNLRVSSGDDGDVNLVNSNDYDSEETIIDKLIFNLNGKLTLNNNADSYECHSLCKERRLSPYSTTGHTSECTNYHLLNSTENNQLTNNTDDPAYRLMQQLIKEGALIKEAVRRLKYTKSESPITL